ncbi:MAG TPA: glycosyltransferase family 2 protein [Gammaproteobacteria bacterium]|nr:glycosyltransferase family 2 protein [Gammaproteobacteria bacterium]
MAARVSVVMPCYNAAPWLEAAVDSVLGQTHGDFELLAVDDGSTDATPRILADAARRDNRVRVLGGGKNAGIVAALNQGLDQARGDYIARMDADDIALPARFARQIRFLEETGVDLCGSWFREFGAGLPRDVRWAHSEVALRTAMLFQSTLCHPTLMAKRQVFERLRYREGYALAEDYDLYARAYRYFRLANVPEVLLRYRRHRAQASQARRDAMESVTRRIRLEMLEAQGYAPNAEERRLHNLVRAPHSLHEERDLKGTEAWLLKLHDAMGDDEARRTVAQQWIRVCVRSAPLGRRMWDLYISSPLHGAAAASRIHDLDLRLLSILKLEYRSPAFELLRRFGLSA